VALLYAAVMLVVLMGFVSFAVDFGRVQSARMELSNAVDAAARYAATGIIDSTTLAKAQAAAAQNNVDGSTLSLLAADVEVGTWVSATRTFTVGGSTPNAVRVTGRRTASRGNPVPLLFARVIGRPTFDVSASSIALFTNYGPDIVGLTSVSMSSNTSRIERLSTETGTVTVGSNGTWGTQNNSQIVGNVYYRGSVPTADITGTKTLLAANMVYPTVSTPAVVDLDLGPTTVISSSPLAGGVYQADSLLFTSGTITLYGDVDLYISGSCTITGSAFFDTDNGDHKLRIYMTGTGMFIHSSSATNYMSVYGPNSTVRVSGGIVCGSALGKILEVINNGKLRYSQLVPLNISPTSGGLSTGGITTVR
jgi:hypothetical protein